MKGRPDYPVRLEGRLDPHLSRWLWVVKWLLAIPHYIVLFFLWIAFVVLTIVAFFAILLTGRYPRGIFDFNLGVLRWTWRVVVLLVRRAGHGPLPAVHARRGARLPSDTRCRLPRTTLAGPRAREVVAARDPAVHPGRNFRRRRRLQAGRAQDWGGWHWWYEGGLILTLVLFAGIALLFMARYPRGLFDFVLGLDRWVARVVAYAGLMTDAYPPFRLDQGGDDPGGATALGAESADRALRRSQFRLSRRPLPRPLRSKRLREAELDASSSSSWGSSQRCSRSRYSQAARHSSSSIRLSVTTTGS